MKLFQTLGINQYWAIFLSFLAVSWVTFTWGDRGHYTGDDHSNQSMYVSGKNFHETGFFELRFTPVQAHLIQPVEPGFITSNPLSKKILLPSEPNPSRYYYTHYPAGPDLFQGLLFRLGIENWWAHRYVQIGISFLGFYIFYLAITAIFSPAVALTVSGLWALSPSFIFFADNFHYYSWFHLFKAIALWIVLRSPSAGMGLVFGVIYSWFSFDPIPQTTAIFLALLPSRKFKVMLAPAAGVFIGFGLHFLRNCWALDGFEPAFKDLYEAFVLRTGSAQGAYAYEFTRHAGKWLIGTQWFFTWPLMVVAALGWWKSRRVSWALAFATGLGGVFWQIVMKQHSMVHGFTYRHLDLWVFLGIGYFLTEVVARDFRILNFKAGFRGVQIALYAIMLIHLGLGLGRVEGVVLKEALVKRIVREDEKLEWASQQYYRVQSSMDFDGVRDLVNRLLESQSPVVVSEKVYRLSNWRARLAELVLYWR